VKMRNVFLVFVICSLEWLSGCARPAAAVRRAPFTTLIRQEAGLTPAQIKNRGNNCLEGCPVLSPTAGYGPTTMIYRNGYVLQHSSIDKIPVWVAEHVVKSQLTGSLDRDDAFAPDPELLPGSRAELKDYAKSGFDRGHQAPAGNQTTNAALKSETFMLSNMCPQLGKLNRNKWKQLEFKTRDWVNQFDGAYEVTGPMFYDPKEDDAAKANGMVTFKQIGANKVSVPTHFFKVVVAKNNGKLQAIGFVMQNKAYPKDFDLAKAIQSLRWIEDHTGLDFLPNLDVAEQNRLEATASAMWP
jgi:endonuclease G, mitochondrial